MSSFAPSAAKILIAFIGRRRGDVLVKAAKAAGSRGGTVAPGKSLTDNRLMQALSLADVQQDVVFIVMGREAGAVVAAVKAAAAVNPRKLGGFALAMDVPELFTRAASAAGRASRRSKAAASARSSAATEARSQTMESGYKLIVVIVNSGYADDVMTVARRAGARGGSIINARGTGTEADVKFFGITLVPEKEMLLVVAEKDKVRPIVDAIATVPTLNEPGGGIIFDMNVEEFIVLGK